VRIEYQILVDYDDATVDSYNDLVKAVSKNLEAAIGNGALSNGSGEVIVDTWKINTFGR
jgi:hypothetical protein